MRPQPTCAGSDSCKVSGAVNVLRTPLLESLGTEPCGKAKNHFK